MGWPDVQQGSRGVVGGGSFSHPALPGWFLEALRRWLPRWRARRNVGWLKSSGAHAVGGRLIVLAASGFHAHGVCALIARLLKALVGGNAAALGVRARQQRATIGSRLVLLCSERQHGLSRRCQRSN